MLSPDNGYTPYLASNKANSGKLIINEYAEEIRNDVLDDIDVIVVDFMAIVFSQPPSGVYSAAYPLHSYCSWLVEAWITPYINRSKKVVLCIDRKILDKDFPLKGETHRKRTEKGACTDFVSLLSLLT